MKGRLRMAPSQIESSPSSTGRVPFNSFGYFVYPLSKLLQVDVSYGIITLVIGAFQFSPNSSEEKRNSSHLLTLLWTWPNLKIPSPLIK